ncbi:hypothetical protein F8388_018632 [Cannabis sativa]|uniref:Proteinase inhibitor n=1 Tax=Cannabis sativa TaxID=3483 RepID=A0A7J6FD02_CANSA|nr:hypothetical protein F8388_018632 [Cannabis sativa]
MSCEGKTSWPELVGVEGEVAEETIERENPTENAKGDTQFRCNRVRVRVNENGIVTMTPQIG